VYTELDEEDEEAICLKCQDIPEELFVLKKCGHAFCESCLEADAVRDVDANGDDVSDSSLHC